MTRLLIFFVVEAGALQPVSDLRDPFGTFTTLGRCEAAGAAIAALSAVPPEPVALQFGCLRAGVPA